MNRLFLIVISLLVLSGTGDSTRQCRKLAGYPRFGPITDELSFNGAYPATLLIGWIGLHEGDAFLAYPLAILLSNYSVTIFHLDLLQVWYQMFDLSTVRRSKFSANFWQSSPSYAKENSYFRESLVSAGLSKSTRSPKIDVFFMKRKIELKNSSKRSIHPLDEFFFLEGGV